MSTDETNENAVEIFEHQGSWVARHLDFPEYSGVGESADEAVFELMTVLENLQADNEDFGCQ